MSARDEDMLLGGRWQPMTGKLSFFEASAEECVEAWMRVRGSYLERTTGCRPVVKEVRGDVEQLLSQLLPLVSIGARRYMFAPIASEGPYRSCLLTDAAHAGNGSLRAWLRQCGIGSVEVVNTAGDPRDPNAPEFHARKLNILRVEVDGVPDDESYRIVGVRMTGVNRWAFDNVGAPLSFEKQANYNKRRKVDRFTVDMLVEYCAALGLRPYDADFYAPSGRALLIEPTNPPSAGTRLLSLADIREPDYRIRAQRTGVPHPDAPP